MSKLLDENHAPNSVEFYDLSRTKSFRVDTQESRIFRACDLVIGKEWKTENPFNSSDINTNGLLSFYP